MSGIAASQHRRIGRTSSAVGSLTAERQRLLDAAAISDIQAIGELCDRHCAALFGIARAILGDAALAESVVVDVVARACVDPGATAISTDGSLRRELARLTYLYAIRCLPAAGQRWPAQTVGFRADG